MSRIGRRALIVGLAVTASVVMVGCGGSSQSALRSPTVQDISENELQTLMDNSEPLVVLDVRTPEEFEAGHIPGSVHIPLDQLADRAGELDPNVPVACVCASGFRSVQAAEILVAEGFPTVLNLEGGLRHWNGDWEPDCPVCG